MKQYEYCIEAYKNLTIEVEAGILNDKGKEGWELVEINSRNGILLKTYWKREIIQETLNYPR